MRSFTGRVLTLFLVLLAIAAIAPREVESQTATSDTVVLAAQTGENITPAKVTLINENPAFITVYAITENGQRVRLADLIGNESKTLNLRKSYMDGRLIGFEVRSRVGEVETYQVEYSDPIRYGHHLRLRLLANTGSILVRK